MGNDNSLLNTRSQLSVVSVVSSSDTSFIPHSVSVAPLIAQNSTIATPHNSMLKQLDKPSTDPLPKFADKIYLVLWYLNFTDLPLTDKEIGKLSKNYGVPSILYYKKLLQRLHKPDFSSLDYYAKFVELGILSSDMKLDDKYLLKLCELVSKNKIEHMFRLIDFDSKTIVEYATSFSHFLQQESEHSHEGYPLPDPEKGRPFLNWNICMYDGCFQKFSDPNDLITHLNWFGCYTPCYHLIHEQSIESAKLTPAYVMEHKLTKCPAYICKQNSYETPDELISHFQELGIKPFWTPGCVIKKKEDKDTKYFEDISGSYYDSEECVVCCYNKPDLICTPCFHRVYCVSCYNEHKVDKCPLCRGTIGKIFPFG